MRESLRLGPTAPMRGVTPLEDTVIGGGKYAVEKGTSVLVHVYATHRDAKVWGEDVRVTKSLKRSHADRLNQAEEFRPERMLDGKFENMPVRCTLPGGER